uniref:Uncharacterized protein n=1 Tax=Tanacetum cinerariifolium TaxID=118510 RepID=A0A699IGR6_TANCI|nr:hypothetical protein [Tanacetum cinerariifolium]
MYGHYDYGAHHNFGGSSSQPNFDGSSSQPNVGGSSSQPNVRGSSSHVRQFSLDDEDFTNVYSLQFSESFREEQSPVEEVEEIQVPVTQKKPTRRRQTAPKKRPQKEKVVDQRCIPWTIEEETALCTCWVRTSEDSVKGNMRKESGFWIDILNDLYNTQKNQEMSELLKIKNRELELKAAELKIRRMENRQRDEALYETTTDEALKERLRQSFSVDFTFLIYVMFSFNFVDDQTRITRTYTKSHKQEQKDLRWFDPSDLRPRWNQDKKLN